jgi:hypothetical protein
VLKPSRLIFVLEGAEVENRGARIACKHLISIGGQVPLAELMQPNKPGCLAPFD